MFMRFAIAAAAFLAAMAAASAADIIAPASAPALPSACSGSNALGRITRNFAFAERTTFKRGFVIDTIGNPRPSGHPFTDPAIGERGVIVRDYCVADAVMSNGTPYAIYYTVEYGQGFASIGNNVDFCVLGLDPWQVHDGDCRTVR